MIVIDRFEGEIAVVEYKEKFYDIPRDWLPDDAKEGDIVVLTMNIDKEGTRKRRAEMQRKMDALFGK
jgi:hypothetical protein